MGGLKESAGTQSNRLGKIRDEGVGRERRTSR